MLKKKEVVVNPAITVNGHQIHFKNKTGKPVRVVWETNFNGTSTTITIARKKKKIG